MILQNKHNIFYSGPRRGFIAMLALVMLILFGVYGVSYWFTSRLSTDMIVKEAHRIKARSFAQAGVEKVKINIINQYNMGNHNLEYPSKFIKSRVDKEYNRDFSDGEYKVISVKAYELGNKTFYNVPHYIKGVVIGKYDIWEIVSSGKVKSSGVEATITTLIKVYRDYVSY